MSSALQHRVGSVADSQWLADPVSPEHIRCVAGADGWLASTRSVEILNTDQPVADTVVSAWKHELQRRSTWMAQRSIRYYHLGVPDKLSIMTEHFCPAASAADTEHSVSGFARWSKEQLRELSCLIDPTGYLSRQKDKYPLFWKSDTRWSPWSCYMAYQMLCGLLKVETNNKLLGYPYDEAERPMNLDQGRLPDDPETIRTYRLRLRSTRRFANELALYREPLCANADYEAAMSLPEYGEGSQVVFENRHSESARLCVVVFGDANAADTRTLLTGMLAETFAEVHFVWGGAVDFDYVDRVRPDVVISQCSERQMALPPLTTFNLRDRAAETLARLKAITPAQVVAAAAVNDSGRMSSVRVLLAPEQYNLDPPGLIQLHGDCDNPETMMRSNAVTLTEVNSATAYFTGPAWWVHDADMGEVLRHEIPTDQKPFRRWWPRKRLTGTTLMFATSAGAHCYYHWMLEILPKLGLLEREGISLDSIDHFMVREISADWQRQTLARFGIGPSRIVETVKQPHWQCDRLLHVDLNCGINLKMHRFIPQWMKHLFPTAGSNEPRLKIYISRPEGVRRGIRNEAQLVPLLKASGFTIIAMEGLSVAEQALLLSRADVLMSPHGGALSNMVFCRPGITVIELFSRHVFPYYYGLAANCGHQYHAILENPLEDYARLVNINVAQSFAANQHETAGLSFDADVDAVAQLLESL